MIYIRTKDGILKTENLKLVEDDRFGRRYINCYNFPYIPLKEADTIEELCDRFVAETCDNTRFWVELKLEYAKTYCGIKNIYGAVWTSKGLIFVAKMNENGELVLI